MLSKKLFLIMIGVYQVCFAIGWEELIFYSTGVVGVVAVPGLQWFLTPKKNVDSFDGYVAFKKKYEYAKRPLPESMKDLNEMSYDSLIQCLDKANKSWKKALEIIGMLEIDDKEEIKNEFDEFCNKNQLCLFKVEKKEKKELGEGVLIEELTKKCTSFCENNKALLEKCQSFRASNLDEFCKEYKVEVDRALKLLNFQVEANKRASGRKIDLEEKAIDLEEKANEKQVLTIKKELLDILHKCYCDSIKNVTNVLNIWRPLVLNINKKKEEWLFKEINQTEKNNIEKMSLFDWVWYLQYKSFCQSNEKSDYWRNYMERCLPLIIFLDGPWAILNFCLLGLSKTSLSVWIFNCGAFHFFFNLMYYSLNSVDELTSFQNSRRELFLDMLEEEGKKMLEEEGKKMEEESKIKE